MSANLRAIILSLGVNIFQSWHSSTSLLRLYLSPMSKAPAWISADRTPKFMPASVEAWKTWNLLEAQLLKWLSLVSDEFEMPFIDDKPNLMLSPSIEKSSFDFRISGRKSSILKWTSSFWILDISAIGSGSNLLICNKARKNSFG